MIRFSWSGFSQDSQDSEDSETGPTEGGHRQMRSAGLCPQVHITRDTLCGSVFCIHTAPVFTHSPPGRYAQQQVCIVGFRTCGVLGRPQQQVCTQLPTLFWSDPCTFVWEKFSLPSTYEQRILGIKVYSLHWLILCSTSLRTTAPLASIGLFMQYLFKDYSSKNPLNCIASSLTVWLAQTLLLGGWRRCE